MKKLLFCFIVLIASFSFGQSVSAQTATLFFSPSSQTLQPGAVFTVTVMVNTGGQQVNAVAAYFTYPVEKLEALQVDTVGSVMQFKTEDTASGGQVRISGGTPTPGFSGTQLIGSVQFRSLESVGTATLSFSADSAVFTDVGNQNILSIPTSGVATFQIVPSSSSNSAPVPTSSPSAGTFPPVAGAPAASISPTPSDLTISDVRAEILSQESVRLSWKTNKATKGQVYYGLRAEENYPFFILDGVLGTEHSFVLTNIRQPAEYTVEIVGVDASGNQTRTDRLMLSELLTGEMQSSEAPRIADRELTVGGFSIRSSTFLMFVLLPVLVVSLAVFLLFRLRKARAKGGA